jgi:hypothetical protein
MIWLFAVFVSLPWQLSAREKDTTQYGMGLIVNVPYPVNEVVPVVEDVVQNGIIRGTKEYNKDEYVSGAEAARSSKVFGPWTEGGQVFYKVRLNAIDPRNFKNGGDVGTLAVRYVLQPQGDKNTVLRIEARFVEDFRKVSHASNGSVEGAEYKDIRDRIETLEVMKNQGIEAQKEKLANTGKKSEAVEFSSSATTSTTAAVTNPVPSAEIPATPTGANSQPQPPVTLEERVHNLKQQVERVVKAPGAPMKSAPFHTASVLQSLPPGTDVLIVISTPYWLGVETHDGQHGWILRDELEQVP